MKRLLTLLSFCFALAVKALGQTSDTGIPPFIPEASFGSIDTINESNLNIHLTIPVITKAGSPPFNYTLTSDTGSAPYHFEGFGQNTWGGPSTSNKYIFNNYNYYSGSFRVAGQMDVTATNCTVGVDNAWIDPSFTSHLFPMYCSGTATATDGSGLTLVYNTNANSYLIYDKSGNQFNPSASSMTDPNGNSITWNSSTNSFTDSLGQTVLTVTPTGSDGHSTTYTYTGPNGKVETFKVNVSTHSVSSNFGCPNVTEYNTSWNLVDSVNLPDGTSYTFSYLTDGRLSQINLPTGGWIKYTYPGANNGLDCTQGFYNAITRSTSDGAVWKITRNEMNGNYLYTTVVTDQGGNVTTFTTAVDGSGDDALVSRVGPLDQTVQCYNGATETSVGAATCTAYYEPSPYTTITQINTYHSVGSMHTLSTVMLDANSNVTDQYSYDWYNGSSYPLLVHTATPRGTWTGSTCTSVGNYISDRPCYKNVYDGSGTLRASEVFSYDSRGNLLGHSASPVANIGASGNLTTSYTYNSNGTVATATDVNSGQTTYGYGGGCNNLFPTSVTNALGTASFAWDCIGGVMTSSTDVNNQKTTYTYGDLNSWRLTQVTDPIGGQVTTTYNTSSTPWNIVQTSEITSTVSVSAKTVLDGLGRVQQNQLTSDPDGIDYVDTAYDAYGNVHSTSNPYRSTSDPTYGITYFAYDALGRVTQQTQPDNNVITASWSSNCTTATDDAGKKREQCTDGLGRLTTVYEPDGSNNLTIETDYQYDPLGNVTQATQKGGSGNSSQWRIRSFSYDGLSRLTQETTPEAGTVTYSYTRAGNPCSGDPSEPCSRTDGRNITTTYTYDAANRLTGKSYSDGVTAAVTYYYDQTSYNGLTIANGKGRRTGMSDGTGQTAWSYDGDGSVLVKQQTIAGVTNVTSYTYNPNSSVNTMTTPNGRVYTYSYAGAGRATALSDNNGHTYVSGAHYAAPGMLISAEHGLNLAITESNSYNNRLEPTVLSASGSGQTVLSLSYNWVLPGSLNNGSVYQIRNNRDSSDNRSFQYSYDQLNRLATAGTFSGVSSPWTTTYSYDNWANLLQKSTSGSGGEPNMGPITADAHNHVNPANYSYDAAGNLTWDGANAMRFDAENRMTPSSGYVYSYDGDGHRVEKNNAGSITYYWYDDNFNVISTTGSPVRDYVYFAGKKIAEITSDGNQHYYWRDHLGSARTMSNSSGSTIEWEADYYPFGGHNVLNNYLSNYFQFTDHEYDYELGDIYSDFREQSPVLGRFFSPDPYGGSMDFANPQSLNRYSYVMNNPLRAVDPLGLECVWDDGSYDSEFDSQTGSVGGCGAAGGTWVELGQNGNWSNQPDQFMQNLVASIQAGEIAEVDFLGQNGSIYQTMYNSAGQTTETVTPDAATFFSYSQPVTNLSQMLSFPPCFFCRGNTFTSTFTPQQIQQFALTHGWSRDLMDPFHKNWFDGGVQLRSGDATCQIHLTIDVNASKGGGGAVGDYHVDQYSPYNPFSVTGFLGHTRELLLGGIPMSSGPTGCLTRNTF